jgi:hypothetical protein
LVAPLRAAPLRAEVAAVGDLIAPGVAESVVARRLRRGSSSSAC